MAKVFYSIKANYPIKKSVNYYLIAPNNQRLINYLRILKAFNKKI